MTPRRWRRVEALVEAVLDHDQAEQQGFLERACGGDESLRREVESLASMYRTAGDFLERPAVASLFPEAVPARRPAPAESDRDPPRVAPGQRLGRFQIEAPLGRGGMGSVFRARDVRAGTAVAVKILDRVSAAGVYRFKREFRALAGVRHRNLVHLYELYAEDDLWFFTMELVAGVDFLRWVGPPAADAERLRSALGQLVEGVAALHRAGKLHCDLKPSNILVTASGRVVVLDFGLVQEPVSGGGTALRARTLGTPAYMSPEQASGRPLTAASDWYTVGLVLFQALTGQALFDGGSVTAWLRRGRSVAPPRVRPGVAAGGRRAALSTLCRRLLDPRPRCRPRLPAIRRLLGAAPPAAAVPHAWGGFVGRGADLARLAAGLDRLQRGRTTVARIHGSSGIGKSALVARFLRQVRRRQPRALVLEGRCYEHESVPYKALDAVVDSLVQHLLAQPVSAARALLPADAPALARLFPALRRLPAIDRRAVAVSDRRERKRRARQALRDLLQRIGAQRPLVVVIDDLQWGDLDSADLLRHVLAGPRPPRMLVVLCYRREERVSSPVLRVLAAADAFEEPVTVEEIALRELGPTASLALARRLLGSRAGRHPQLARRLAREAGGSPFFLTELARHLRATASAAAAVEVVAGRGAARSGLSLDTLIASRLDQLPAGSRRLMEVVAVAGRPLAIEDALATASALGPIADGVLADLHDDSLLRGRRTEHGDAVEAYHDRIREAVVAALPADRRRRCHRGLARVLQASGRGDTETLAEHWAHGGDSARAAVLALRAADQAGRALAFDRAARLYRRALGLGAAERDPTLRLRLGEALANAGRGAEAARAFLQAALGAPPLAALELRRRAAEQQLRSGRIDEGVATMRSVLAAVGVRVPGGSLGSLLSLAAGQLRLWRRGIVFEPRSAAILPPSRLTRIDACRSLALGLSNVQPLRARDFARRYLLLALDAGEPVRLAQALALEAGFASLRGAPSRQRVRALIAASLRLARRAKRPDAAGLAQLAAAMAVYFEGRGGEAIRRFRRAETLLRERCTGVVWELDTLLLHRMRLLVFLGRLRLVAARLPAALADCVERGDRYAEANLRGVAGWLVRLVEDRPGRALNEVRRIRARWSRRGFHLQHYFHLVGRVQITLYRRRGTIAAWRHLRSIWPRLLASSLLHIELARIELVHLRCRTALAAAVEAGIDTPLGRRARAGARRDLRRLSGERHPWAPPLAALCRAAAVGLDHLDGGGRDAAEAALGTAIEGFERHGLGLYAAVARRRLGQLLGGTPGARSIAEAERWMAAEGVRDPGRIADLLAPGRWS